MDIAVIIRERGASGAPPGHTTVSARGSKRHTHSKWADFEIYWTPETPPGMSCGWAPLPDGWVCWLAEKTTILELRRALSATSATHDDAEIMRQAIERWGFDAVHKTHSVWAGAIWQEGQAKFCFYRDRIGMVPVFYFAEHAAGTKTHIFSTSVALIQRHFPAAREINFERLRRFLLMDDTPRRDDFFRGIRRLHPGEAWHFGFFAGEPQVRRYWQPQTPDNFAHSSLQSPADFLIRSLKNVVRDYAEAGYVPLTAVSGGLDSSLLLALQVECAREMGADAPHIAAATMGLPSFPSVDETTWTRQLQKHLDHPIASIYIEDQWPMRDPGAYIRRPEMGPEFHPGAGYESAFIQRATQEFGPRDLFFGIGADQLLIINDYRMLGSLLADSSLSLRERLMEAERRVGRRRLARYLIGNAPAVPALRRIRDRFADLLGATKLPDAPWVVPRLWVLEDALESSSAHDEAQPDDPSFLPGWGWELAIRGLWRKNHMLNASHHLAYLRADFIQDLFTIEPHHVNLGEGHFKGLLRRMGRGYLPRPILERRKGGLFSKFVEFGLSLEHRGDITCLFGTGSQLADFGLIESDSFLDAFWAYCEFCSPTMPLEPTGGAMYFWRTVAAELWLRKLN